MKKEIERLVKNYNVREKPIFLFGNTFMTYEALKVFANHQIKVTGMIATVFEVQHLGYLYGVKLYTYEQFCIEYKGNANVLISSADFKIFRNSLYDLGYRLNKNMFIDYCIKVSYKKVTYLFWQIFHGIRLLPIKWRQIRQRIWEQIKNNMSYIKEYSYIYYGWRVYQRIQKKYDENLPILLYDYSGLGDVFVFSALIAGNKKEVFDHKFILTVIGKASKRVAQMFGLANIEVLSDQESLYLSHFAKALGEQCQVFSITPFSRVMHTEIISRSLAGCRIHMLDMYKYVFLKLDEDAAIQYPKWNCLEKEIKSLLIGNGLKPEKTVILSPYANTVIGFPVEFWTNLSQKLKEKKYFVCTNCSGSEREIPGTVRLSFGLEIAEAVLNMAGYFVAIRNGFCDIVSNSTAKKIIIYPIYPLFNSDVYEFCSLKKMGIGRNFVEIQWKYNKYDELVRIIEGKF